MTDPNPLAALVRRVNRGSADVPDADLLDRFVRSADQAAFELLVWRHGGMVWGVCRRMLGRDRAAAEDACQAVFVALAKHAARLRSHSAVGGWLHRVAVRASIDLSRSAAQFRPANHSDPLARDRDPLRQASDREVGSLLDTALNRLPDKFRVPFVLCELEGRTNAEAAATLGCPVGTVESRLTRARRRLRDWLTARGVVPAVTTAAVVLPETARAAMVRAADPARPSAAVKALAAHAIPPTVSTQVRALVAVGFVLVAGAVGLGMTQGGKSGRENPPHAKAADANEPSDPPRPSRGVEAVIVYAAMYDAAQVMFLVPHDTLEPGEVAPPLRLVAKLDGTEAQAFGINGKQLDTTELARRLPTWTRVMVTPAELGLPDRVSREVLNDQGVIFLIPQAYMWRMAKAAGARRKGDGASP